MTEPIKITSQDPILEKLKFRAYRSIVERRAVPFLPGPNDPQTLLIKTPWGGELTAKYGDILISELETPNDFWCIDPQIFEVSYMVTRPGYCVKRALVHLVPLTDLTNGDADRMVMIETLEGPLTVRAGDFYLARGIKGEIWPYFKEKVPQVMKPVE